MDPIQISTREAILYFALINAAIGFTLGLIPLLFGYFNKQLRTGLLGIVVGTIGGAVLGIFASVPSAIFFTWLVVRRSKAAVAQNATVDNDE